jgi:hypothetical protein
MVSDIWNVVWDESAVRLCRLARQDSFALGDEYLGAQHLLLAAVTITPQEEHGARGLCRDAVLAALVEVVGLRDPSTVLISPGGQTPRAKLALERAMERAVAESRAVSVPDIWFGLLADPDSDCARVLHHLGIRTEELQRQFA